MRTSLNAYVHGLQALVRGTRRQQLVGSGLDKDGKIAFAQHSVNCE